MDETPASSPAAPAGVDFERRCLEALKTLGKALGQMTLYRVGHPAVIETIRTAREHLDAALASGGELTASLDQQKLLVNGRVVGAASQLPNTILNLYDRFKLTSLTFRAGLTHEELAGFCELAALRPDAAAAVDPKAFLSGKGVTHLSLNEALYLKAGRRVVGEGAGAETAEDGSGGSAEGGTCAIDGAISSGSIERTMTALVEKSVSDPTLRARVIARVMKLLESDVVRRVEEATLPLRREKEAVESEAARTAGVVSNMAEGVVVVDADGKILMMNPAAEQIYGATLAAAAGKGIVDKVGDRLVVALARDLRPAGEAGVKPDVTIAGAEDVKRTLSASSAVVKTESGKIVGVVAGLPDAAKYRELQRMERDFVAHVTHELRAPLSSIRAALEIMQSELGANAQAEEARIMASALKNSDRLAEMINGILDFSKIESGQMTVFTKPAEPGKIASEAVDSLQPWARKKSIALTLDAGRGLPLVDADAPRTVQVLVNLLSNAIKFTPSGGKIVVKLGRRAEGASACVEFAVADSGPGIPKEEQQRVFEKFAQIASGDSHAGGTGLGLSIAKALVHLQKGKMWIESELGSGATFLFTLPASTAQAIEAASLRAKAPARPRWKALLGLK